MYVRLGKQSGWSHGCDPPTYLPFGTSTHIEIRDVGGTFSVSFNGMVQCTTVFTGPVLPARTDYTSVQAPPDLRRMSWRPRVRVIQLAIVHDMAT